MNSKNVERLDESDLEVARIDHVVSLSVNLQNALDNHRLLNGFKFSQVTIDKIRDDFYKFYKKHILKCNYFISSSNLLNKRIIIREDQNEHTSEVIKNSFARTFYFQNKWLIDLVKDWPFFSNLSDVDFTALIHKSQFLAFAFKITEFKVGGECYSVFEDNVWHSKKLMIKHFGLQTTERSFQVHNNLNELKLTEKERALFYPFIMSQCNETNINDKQLFFYLKAFYTHVLFTEFLNNNRDVNFISKLNQAFQQLSNIVNNYSVSYK